MLNISQLEEILRWYYYGKEFLIQVSAIVQDGKGKIGEKKAKGIIYDKLLEHLSILRKRDLKTQVYNSQKYHVNTCKGKPRKRSC